MITIDVLVNDQRVDRGSLPPRFYILQHVFSRDSILEWKSDDDQPGKSKRSILTWLSGPNEQGSVSLFLLPPGWHLYLGTQLQPQVPRYNVDLQVPFTLQYGVYKFVFSQQDTPW